MSSDPDPHITEPVEPKTPSSGDFTDTMDRFVRRYAGFALKKKEKADNEAVVARRGAIVAQAKVDIAQLRSEFDAHPMPPKIDPAAFADDPDGLAEAYANRAAAVDAVFDAVTITPVSGTCPNVSINGVVEIDPESLRLMAPSKRQKIFDAANLEKGSAAQKDAISKLTGTLRLRTQYQVADGKAHLEKILPEGPHKTKLGELYAADGEQNKGGHRAFDISNKIKTLKDEARVVAEAKHGAMLTMALTLPCESLSEMVTNFEFAEMTFNGKVDDRAQEIANANAKLEKDKRVAEMRAQLTTKESQLEQLAEDKAAFDIKFAAVTRAFKDYEASLKEGEKRDSKHPAVQEYYGMMGERTKLKHRQIALDGLTEEAIREIEDTVEVVAPTSDDIQAAALEVAGDDDARREMLAEMDAKLRDYTEAVPITGNAPAKVAVEMDRVDIALNAAVARGAASHLRFNSVKAAGYHTLKHHTKSEMADITEADKLRFDTPVQRKVAHYHDCARAAVASGEVVLSQVRQNGGEDHLYKHRGVTAIVWMNNNETGLSTFFKM